jgi:hypothetical protein
MKTPSIPRSVRIVFAVLYLGFLFYSIIIVQQLLIGILLPLLLTGLGYLVWRIGRLVLLLEEDLEERRET